MSLSSDKKAKLLAKVRALRKTPTEIYLARNINKAMPQLRKEGITSLLPEKHKHKVIKKILEYIEPMDHPKASHTVQDQAIMLAEHIMGDSQLAVETKHQVSSGYVRKLLVRHFGSREQLDEILEDVLLENALVASSIFERKKETLTARDAATAAGIFTQRYLEKKRARENPEAPILPVHVVLKMEQTLSQLKIVPGKTLNLPE